jgi:tRNA U34 5-methylaminomethyl-2-thiouridine-forming methyltransferase MnmC
LEKFRIVNTSLGIPSIQFVENGEIMHNPVGPWQESHQLYLTPMRFKEHLQNPLKEGGSDPLVVFDVGLGAATNAIAAMSAWETGNRDLRIISFEKDLDLLKFTLDHRQAFPFLQGWEQAIRCILETGIWQDSQGSVSWKLSFGDFNSTIEKETEKAEIIFYEPYSPKVNQEMWSLPCFSKLFARARLTDPGCLLATYSRATSVRSALLLAGFYVGAGVAIGQKNETTLASTQRDALSEVMGERWIQRLKNSTIPFPRTTHKDDWPKLIQKIEQHPQFI